MPIIRCCLFRTAHYPLLSTILKRWAHRHHYVCLNLSITSLKRGFQHNFILHHQRWICLHNVKFSLHVAHDKCILGIKLISSKLSTNVSIARAYSINTPRVEKYVTITLKRFISEHNWFGQICNRSLSVSLLKVHLYEIMTRTDNEVIFIAHRAICIVITQLR